jgi:clan AA aspartic protease (TIGR02281 family)
MRYLITRWTIGLSMVCLFMAGVSVGWWMKGQGAAATIMAAAVDSDRLAEDSLAEHSNASRVLNPGVQRSNTPLSLADINGLPRSARQSAYVAYLDRVGEDYEALLALAGLFRQDSVYPGAIAYLLRAALQVESEIQQHSFDASLAGTTDDYARSLTGSQQLQTLDKMYEDITLALPEQTDYFLALGLLRIQMGNPAGALSPLAQIQNHTRLGAQARRLMASIEADAVESPVVLETLTLRRVGDQFLVQGRLDQRRDVTLLIDTGAAMTMLEPRLLASLGYGLDGREAYFSTANGVVAAPVVALDRLSLGQAGVDHLPVGGLTMGMSPGVDGLLGMNFLRHYEFRIDQSEGLLYLQRRRP